MARGFVAGKLTWWGWSCLTLGLISLSSAPYFFATGDLLGGIVGLMNAITGASLIYTGWKNDKA